MSSNYNLQFVQKLVRQGEGQTLEFKRKANFPEKIIREMVAFANTDGGYLLMGVDDNGSIPGLKYAEEEKYILEKSIDILCKPKIKYSLHHIALYNGRSVLVYRIYKSSKRPHYALEKPAQKWGKAYIRKNDKSLQASRETIEILKGVKHRGGQKIYYGEKENLLLKYLEQKGSITLSQYTELADLSKKIASKSLVQLVLSNVLRIVHEERGEYFIYNNQIPQ